MRGRTSRGIQGFGVRATSHLNRALGRTGSLFAAFGRYWIDAWSSAAWFAGWAEPIRGDEVWKRELLAMAKPTAAPETWLLASGWKRHGLLRFDERPG